jgi:hypothetical protein
MATSDVPLSIAKPEGKSATDAWDFESLRIDPPPLENPELEVTRRLDALCPGIEKLLAELKEDPDLMTSWDMGPPSACPDIRGKTNAAAAKLMCKWFRCNFEDPAEDTPYDSEEGGYVFIWGGPCDAREELEAAFGQVASDKAIADAVNEIEQDGCGWAWVPSQSRMQEEISSDAVIAARQRLWAVLGGWRFDALGGAAGPTARFSVRDVVTLLHATQRRSVP